MAQRTGKEETEFKVHDSLTFCANNCGVTGNPATKNMCQKCFNATTATSSSPPSSSAVVPSVDLPITSKKPARSAPVRSLHRSVRLAVRIKEIGEEAASEEKKVVNRCSCCRRKVGLTGFRCRCGEMFCGEHRYSDRHDCSYDYKTVGREAIARENPVVKAAKIVKV